MWVYLTGTIFAVLVCTICVEAQTAQEQLDKVANDYWQWKLKTFPEWATSYGYHQYDDTLTQYTEDAYVANKVKCEGYLKDLEAVKAEELPSKVARDTLAVIREEIGQYVVGFRWRNYTNLNPVNFLEGVWETPFWTRARQFRNLRDYQMYLRRMKLYPIQLSQVTTLMRQAIALGRTNHIVSLRTVPDRIEKQQNETGEDSPFYEPFKTRLLRASTVPKQLWEDLQNNATSIINDEIIPAWGSLRTFLKEEYMNNTRNTYGVSGWENGLEFYKACLRFHLGFDMSPEEIRETGKKEIARIRANMEKIMRENGFEGTISEFTKKLRTDPAERSKYYDKTPEWLLDRYRYLINERINDETMLRMFHTMAPVSCRVKETSYGAAGSYALNVFYVNTNDAQNRPTYTMTALTAHEANPGHHYQMSRARILPFHKFRQYMIDGGWSRASAPFAFPWYTAYTEGWGLYSEYLGKEMGIYNRSALELFGRYSEEIFRACRLVLDTGLHAFNMSRQEAIWLLANYTADPLSEIENEVDRYITWPGQACAYKVGEMEIKRWRRDAESRLGPHFDIRDFHEVIINTGRAPLQVAKQSVENYIQETLKKVTSAAPNVPFELAWATFVTSAFICLIYH